MIQTTTFPVEYLEIVKHLHKEDYQRGDLDARKFLIEKKFKPKVGDHRVFFSPCGKFLIKYSYIVTKRKPRSKFVVPTFFTKRVRRRTSQWVLQVRVQIDRGASNRALKFFNAHRVRYDRIYDIHGGNVGMLDGQPVIFDF